jgi:GDP-4-dehydro-6-deoxy-D-mannose reductase
MRALITGVGGFCGAHLVRRLRQEPGIEISGLGRRPEPAGSGLSCYFCADITDAAAVASAVKRVQPEILFHLAGLSGNDTSPADMYGVNTLGTVNVLEAVYSAVPECTVVVIGSAAEYGIVDLPSLPVTESAPCRPIGTYGASKYAATLIALDYARKGVKVSVTRPFNLVGSGIPASLVAGALIARARQALALPNPVVRIGDFDSERDFIAVQDAVDAYVRLAQEGSRGEVFNICSGHPRSVQDVARTLLANSKREIELFLDPNLVPPSPVRTLYGSYEKARRAIGFEPKTTLEQALKEAWDGEIKTGSPCESLC